MYTSQKQMQRTDKRKWRFKKKSIYLVIKICIRFKTVYFQAKMLDQRLIYRNLRFKTIITVIK